MKDECILRYGLLFDKKSSLARRNNLVSVHNCTNPMHILIGEKFECEVQNTMKYFGIDKEKAIRLLYDLRCVYTKYGLEWNETKKDIECL